MEFADPVGSIRIFSRHMKVITIGDAAAAAAIETNNVTSKGLTSKVTSVPDRQLQSALFSGFGRTALAIPVIRLSRSSESAKPLTHSKDDKRLERIQRVSGRLTEKSPKP